VAATDTAPIAPVTLHWRKQLRASAKPAYLGLAGLAFLMGLAVLAAGVRRGTRA